MSLWQKTMLYLGLVDEDEIEEAAAPDRSHRPEREERAEPGPQLRQTAGPQDTASGPIRQLNPNRGARRIEPPDPSRRRPTTMEQKVHTDTGVVVRRSDYGAGAHHAEIIVAETFADAKRLADLIRERVPVVVNLRDTEPDMVRRLVDFSSGLIYALDGTMKKVAEGVILVSPPRVSLSPDEERRLSDLGLYTLP